MGSALADRRLTPRSNEAVSAITEALAPPKMPRTSPITLPPPPRNDEPVVTSSILLLEDEATLRSAISRFLRTLGYEVDVAEDGRAALDALHARRYDLILLDLRMQGITGEDVYETMIDLFPEQAARVVFMTGDMHSDHAARFVRQTGRPVLAKPFTLTELDARLRQILGNSQ